ncbi:MAG: AAA family ATPase [Caldilineales bacterium]|nr:AAA family ATPase [Caldilineales bacterium]
MASVLQVRLFGSIDVCMGERSLLKPPTLKSQSLLAYLLVHRRQPHPRERLADLFWGERPEEKAHHSLATALWHIRRCLGDGVIVSDLHTVFLAPEVDCWLDSDAFADLAARRDLDAAQEAVSLYRGDFLDGFYDDWVISERYRLEALYTEALARLMTGREVQGDFEAALAAAGRLLACDPLREDAHRLAMRTFAALGRRGAALEQYRRCQNVLRKELGADPMPETTALAEAIRSDRLGESVGTATTPLQSEPPVPLTGGRDPFDALTRGRLVGREQEWTRLRARWVEAKAGRGLPVFIRGEAGRGKTRLMEDFSQWVRWQGGRVLWGRCFEFERVLPYQPVAEALHSLLPSLAADEAATLSAWTLIEVERLAPEIGELRPRAWPAPGGANDADPQHLFEGVARFLSELSGHGPILIVLEDLHWATGPTLDMVHHLAQRLNGRPALLAITFRPEALASDHPLNAMSRRLSREGKAEVLTLAPLALQDVERFVNEMSGRGEEARSLAGWLYRETEGNPFFLMQVIKALFEAGVLRMEGSVWQGELTQAIRARLPLPATMGEAILARARRVPETTQEALSVAAVLGREFDFDLLAAIWGQGEEATLAAVEDLLRHRLIEEGTGPLGRDYAFTHHKIQEVLYAELPQQRRRRIHGRVGEGMEHVYATQAEALAGELAFHFEQGRGHDPALTAKALRYLWLAGDRARTLYASQEAIDYYQRALAIAQGVGDDEAAAHTLLRLGQTHHSVFAFEAARQVYDEGFALWQKAEAIRVRALTLPPAPHPFRLLYVYHPLSVDPILGDASVTHHVFSGLVEESPEMEVIPDAAWRWEALDGGRRYLFHLRSDAAWTDGAPVTAKDFEYAWKRVLSQRDSPAARFLYDIANAQDLHEGRLQDSEQVGVKAVDDLTLAVTLAQPAAYFLHLLALPAAFPIPRHVVEQWGDAWTQPEHIASNGAFQLLSWRRGDKIVLTRNPGFSRRFTGNLQEIHLLLNSEALADWRLGLAMYQASEIDAVMIGNLPQAALVEVERRFRQERKVFPVYYTVASGFDVRRPPFDDVRVREAFARALDVIPVRAAQGKDHWAIDRGGWIPARMPGHRPGVGLPYDLDRARQLLAEAGYPDGRGFPPIRFRTFYTPEAEQTVPAWVGQWRDNLGIDITAEVVARSEYLAGLAVDRPHVFGLSWWGNYPDPDDWLRQAMAQVRRFTGWQNPTYDRLVEEARREFDHAARMRLYHQAEDLLLHEASVAPMFYPHIPMLVKPWVKHYATAPMQGEQGWKAIVIEEH